MSSRWTAVIVGIVYFAGTAAAQNTSLAAALSQRLEGQVITGIDGPSDSEITETLANHLRWGASPIFRPSSPAFFIKAASEQDVVQGVLFALENNYKLSLRGQGHHESGTSLQPGGVTIDQSDLKEVHVDPVTYSCRFQAGLHGIELVNITSQYGLHYRIGHAGSNGISGFTLGGGGGWAGLAVDLITGFDVVNTWEYPGQELQIKHVSLSSYPDLFYALQGAGQMTGIVVAFYANLQPIREDGLVRVVQTFAPLPTASEMLGAWLPYSKSTKSPLIEKGIVYMTDPDLGPAAVLFLDDWSPDNRTGTADFLDGWIAIADEMGFKVQDAEMPYLETVLSFSASQQYPGVAHYAYSHVFPDPQAGNILEVVEAAMANATTPQSLIIIDIIEDGAGAKSNDDTAYSWRGNYVTYIWAFWTRTEGGAEVDGDAGHVAWVQDTYEQLKEYSIGHYINFVNFEVPEDTQKCFSPQAWPKIQAAKAAYDPHHLLRELDFYHNDAGRGPLDAASVPVSA